MHTKERGWRVLAAAVRIGRFLRRRKRLGIALLVVAPLLTGMGLELFRPEPPGPGHWVSVHPQPGCEGADRTGITGSGWSAGPSERSGEHQRWLGRREQEAEQTAG